MQKLILLNRGKEFLKNYFNSHKSSKLNCALGFGINPFISFRVLWDIEDNMDTYVDQTAFDAVWVPSASTIKGNPTTDVIDFDTAGVNVCYRDLTSMSDTTWISRCKITLTTTGVSPGILFVMFSNNTSNAQTVNNGLGFYIYDADNNCYAFENASAQRPDQTSNNGPLDISPSNTTYYCEMKRTSATSFTVTFYSDSTFTTSLGTATLTISSGNTGLRYIKLLGYTSGAMIGTYDNFQLMKTQSTPPS